MATSFIPEKQLSTFIKKMRTLGEVFWNKEVDLNWNKKEEGDVRYSLQKIEEDKIDEYEFPPYRSSEGLKPLLFNPIKKVAEYPGSPEAQLEDIESKVVLGVKSCDLVAMRVYDEVFIEDEEFVDPFYKKLREELFIVSADCEDACDSCFCNLLDNKPYPTEEEDFDLNVTPVESGYIVESGSQQGEEFLEGLQITEKVNDRQLSEREEIRNRVEKKLDNQNKEYETEKSMDELVIENYEDEAWEEPGSRCVMDGACTNVCPTCFCHNLFDRKENQKEFVRMMAWDSCAYQGFSAMAGGMNPRFGMLERFKHRYNHKYHHFVEQYGMIACSGCGRCIENCMGEIDMRKVISSLEKSSKKVAK